MKIYRVKVIGLLFSTPAKNKADAYRSFQAMAKAEGMNPDWVKKAAIYRRGAK